MSMSLPRARVFVASACLAIGGALLLPNVAAAHHNTVSCQSPGVWLIVNSEPDKTETFITDQGHTGTIEAGGSTTVNYSGTSLTVTGTWSNGVVQTNSGTGDCTTPENTQPATTEPATTEPATTEPATTEPATTEPATTEPATTEPVTTEPVTTQPETTTTDLSSGGATSPTDPAPGAGPAGETSGFDDRAGETSGLTGTLPETGTETALGAVVGGVLVLLGGAALVAGRRRPVAVD